MPSNKFSQNGTLPVATPRESGLGLFDGNDVCSVLHFIFDLVRWERNLIIENGCSIYKIHILKFLELP